MTENSTTFFANKACAYYPCHTGAEELNCLFCYCPFYLEENCPGDPVWLGVHGNCLKDCSSCTFPHKAENFSIIVDWIIQANARRKHSAAVWSKAYPEEAVISA